MFAGFGAAEDTNQRFRALLDAGQTGLSIAYDMPTLYGYDTDSPEAEGEFGTCGVAVSSLADMEVLLDGLPLDRISTSMTINSPAAPVWAMYIAAAEKRGVPRTALEGTIQNDILKEFVAQKEFLFPPEPSMRLVTDTIEFGTRELPRWNTISISGYHIREAGSTAVQELAFTIADGMAYVEAALARGLRVDDFAPRLSFFFNSHSDFFEEIAKFRAARRIWWKLMSERYRAENERSTWMRFHTQTAGVSLTAQQPLNNLTRVAVQALAAVLGGTQSLHTDAYDEAWAVPSAEAALLALRQQQIIAEETGVASTVDPLGGSWFVESLTNETERAVWRYLDEIDARGGMVAAIAAGYPQREIADAAYRFQREVDDGERTIVGVNRYVGPRRERWRSRCSRCPRNHCARQLERLGRVRRERDAAAVATALAGLRENAAPARLLGDEPHAVVHPRGRGLRHAGRDVRRPARGLRRVPRARGRIGPRPAGATSPGRDFAARGPHGALIAATSFPPALVPKSSRRDPTTTPDTIGVPSNSAPVSSLSQERPSGDTHAMPSPFADLPSATNVDPVESTRVIVASARAGDAGAAVHARPSGDHHATASAPSEPTVTYPLGPPATSVSLPWGSGPPETSSHDEPSTDVHTSVASDASVPIATRPPGPAATAPMDRAANCGSVGGRDVQFGAIRRRSDAGADGRIAGDIARAANGDEAGRRDGDRLVVRPRAGGARVDERTSPRRATSGRRSTPRTGATAQVLHRPAAGFADGNQRRSVSGDPLYDEVIEGGGGRLLSPRKAVSGRPRGRHIVRSSHRPADGDEAGTRDDDVRDGAIAERRRIRQGLPAGPRQGGLWAPGE